MVSDLAIQRAIYWSSPHLLVGFTRQPQRNTPGLVLHFFMAFDRVWHEGALEKLPTFGFSPSVLSWTWSLINNRITSVQIDGAYLNHFLWLLAFLRVQYFHPPYFFIHWWFSAQNLQPNPLFCRWHQSPLFVYLLHSLQRTHWHGSWSLFSHRISQLQSWTHLLLGLQ